MQLEIDFSSALLFWLAILRHFSSGLALLLFTCLATVHFTVTVFRFSPEQGSFLAHSREGVANFITLFHHDDVCMFSSWSSWPRI